MSELSDFGRKRGIWSLCRRSAEPRKSRPPAGKTNYPSAGNVDKAQHMPPHSAFYGYVA